LGTSGPVMPRRERNIHSILDALGTWEPCGNEGPVPIQRGTSQADIVGAAIPGKLRPLGALARISTQASRRTAAYRLALGVVVPQVPYYAGVRLRLGVPAIIAVVAWAAVFAVYNWRRPSLSPFVLYGVAVTVSEGAAALLIRDPLVFAAGSVVENLFDGLGFLTSVAVDRPLRRCGNERCVRDERRDALAGSDGSGTPARNPAVGRVILPERRQLVRRADPLAARVISRREYHGRLAYHRRGRGG
jgi:hypothetical protein